MRIPPNIVHTMHTRIFECSAECYVVIWQRGNMDNTLIQVLIFIASVSEPQELPVIKYKGVFISVCPTPFFFKAWFYCNVKIQFCVL